MKEIRGTDVTTEQMSDFYLLVQSGYINNKVLRKFLKHGGEMANYPEFEESMPIPTGQMKSFWERAHKKQIVKKSFQDFLDKVHFAREKSENKKV